ncbi:aminoglycoside phosphotransferase family protein [Actinoplanes sp. DH11]|uniref:aminoglycoside phosphotransferase family protein n=1 Tax=Actinoplanes sp. DH11 TaxID=2857011 RepID=UPI0035B1EB4D
MLPTLIEELRHDWQLRLEEPFPLSINWVTRVRRADGSRAVLKLGVPGAGHLADEATALEFFAGRGAVEMLARDDSLGALLLEEARPGTPVTALVPTRGQPPVASEPARDEMVPASAPARDEMVPARAPARDEAATAALIEVIRRLHRPAPPGLALPTLAARGAAFDRHLRRFPGDDPLPRRLVERAAELFTGLCASPTEQARPHSATNSAGGDGSGGTGESGGGNGWVVLHGDLHHGNVLAAEREPWLAIDPHGLVGDAGYEVGACLYNPDPWSGDDTVLGLLPARVEQLADGLGMSVERVAAWGFVQAMLCEVWTFEGEAPASESRASSPGSETRGAGGEARGLGSEAGAAEGGERGAGGGGEGFGAGRRRTGRALRVARRLLPLVP